ncbi:MAG TPA: hypothetical protein ENH28_06770 [Euryarchaeota archaeon]|nr:hypothetical protein [Euryarchaeota archaeon]
MDKYEELANEIIDQVCDVIEEHYEIVPKILVDGDEIDSPALINGAIYYDLEENIAGLIKKHTELKDKENITEK